MNEKYFLVQIPSCDFLADFPTPGSNSVPAFTASLSDAAAFVSYDDAFAVARDLERYNLYVFRGDFS